MYGHKAFDHETLESAIWDEFRATFVKDFICSITLFFKGAFLLNEPHTALLMNKPVQYMKAKKLDIKQPDTVLSNNIFRVKEFFNNHGKQQAYLKQMDRINIKGCVVKFCNMDLDELVPRDDEVKEVPNCWQEFCPKDVEFRTSCYNGVIYHTRIDSMKYEHTQEDFRNGQDIPEIFVLEEADSEVKRIVNAICGEYNLNAGTFDLIRDKEGNYWYLECNETGQFMFHTRFTGAVIERSLAENLLNREKKTY